MSGRTPDAVRIPAGGAAAARRDWLLLVYRVVAIVVGVGLVVLVFVGVPLQLAGHNQVVAVVGPLHGFLYIAYLLLAANLWLRERWPIWFALPVGLAGTVPLLSFVAERQVNARVQDLPPPWPLRRRGAG